MQVGDLVVNRFFLEKLAGTGGMGSVFRAVDRQSGRPVALKLLHGTGAADGTRFVREAEMLAALHHPGIVAHVAHGTAPGGQQFLAMEWLEGEDLSERLAHKGLTLREAIQMCAAAASALGAAHARGIIHRDIKPSNIFLFGGDPSAIKLLDFGIARLTEQTRLTHSGAIIGTPGYMAPEQARAEQSVDARADVFALGCVLFESCTGRPVFVGDQALAILAKILLEEAPRASDLRGDIPAELDDLISRMLAKDPALRPANAAEVAAELTTLAPVPDRPRSAPTARRQALTHIEQRLVSLLAAGADVGPVEAGHALTLRPEEQVVQRQALAAAVEPYGAELEILSDGSLLGTFAGQGAATDQTARAARCALAVRAALGGRTVVLATGRGVLTGGLPVGEVIDRAASLLKLSPTPASDEVRGGVRIDEVTAGLLDVRFEVSRAGSFLWLVGEREVSAIAGESRTLLGKATPFVGRERELATLSSVLSESFSDGVARVALVTGSPGVGKSRLLYELLGLLVKQHEGLSILWGRADPMSAGSPFGLLGQAVRRAAGIHEGESLALRQQKLRARLQRRLSAASLERVLCFLAELVGAPFPDDHNIELCNARQNVRLLGDQIRRAWEDWFSAECQAGPLLLVLEDLHWGDLPTIKCVDQALRNLCDRPLAVLALARPEIRTRFDEPWAERGVTELRLGELSPRASEKLVREALQTLPAERVKELVVRSTGNPLFLEELIRAEAAGDHRATPATVVAMLQSRLESLDLEARRVLRASSIFGQVFWRGGIAALLGGGAGAPRLGEWLDELQSSEIISRRYQGRFDADEEYVFRHALVAEAAYSMLTEEDRARGHRLAGDWLEQKGEADPLVLAEHFQRARELKRAALWYRRSAEQALAGDDFTAALERAENALRCDGADQGEASGACHLIIAECHRWQGNFPQAERSAGLALAQLPRGERAWCAAAGEAALASGRLGNVPVLLGLAGELLSLPSLAEPRAHRVMAMARLASYLTFGGRHVEAGQLLQQIATHEEPHLGLADAAASGWTAHARANRELTRGDAGVVIGLFETAVRCFETAGSLRDACLARVNLGAAYNELGLYRQAEETLGQGLELANRLGLANVAAGAQQNLGVCLARQGRLEEGHERERAAVLAFAAQGERRMTGGSRIYLAEILFRLGRQDEAAEEAREALDVLATVPGLRAYALGVSAQLALHRGARAEAMSAASEALDLAESLGGLEAGDALVRLVHAECLHALGDPRALAAIDSASQRLLSRAARIHQAAWQATFLGDVPEHARTLALARSWRGR